MNGLKTKFYLGPFCGQSIPLLFFFDTEEKLYWISIEDFEGQS